MKTSKVSKVYPNYDDGVMTKTSNFIHFLLRICFLSVTQKDDRISFSKCKTSIYISLNIIWLIINTIVTFMTDANKVTEAFNKEVISMYKMTKMNRSKNPFSGVPCKN